MITFILPIHLQNVLTLFKKTYLGILFFRHKTGFFCVLVFIVFQAFFTYKGVQTIPFFNYGMFSEPFISSAVQEKYIIKLDGERLDVEDSNNNIFPYMLYENLRIYKKLVDPDYDDVVLNSIHHRFEKRTDQATLNQLIKKIWNDDESVKKFPKWLHHFIEKRTGEQFQILEFEIEYYTYTHEKYNLIGTESILKHEY